MATAIPRKRVTDLLEERLRADILGGHHAPHTLLPPERELAEYYGVNRTTLRHALSRLEHLGLVETRHGVGTRVLPFEQTAGAELIVTLLTETGPDAIPQLLDARRLLGALIAREAARSAKAADRAELRRALTRLANAAPGSPAHEAENDVHRALAGATGNAVLRLLVNTFVRAYDPVREMLDAAFADPAEIAAELRPVIDAIRSADPAAAEAAADAYLRASANRFTRVLGGQS
ncbi:MAG TPA: GntR family transcriptional regulator [Acidimicrobiia bacterium]|nr:GntR family transcriptional regulator [Acidimicrobiia bacterium]